MSEPVQKDFHLQRTDQFFYIIDSPTMVTIRQATEVEISLHERFLEEIKDKCSRTIEFGARSYSLLYSSFCADYLWHLRSGNPHPRKNIVDDKVHRFLWVKDYCECALCRYEIELTMAACNILDESKKPIFTFVEGHMGKYPSLDCGETSLSLWEEEVHEKVLEMNPSWKGESAALVKSLRRENRLEYQTGDLKNWRIESIFSQAENYLYSLLEEINRAVFNGIGRIKADVSEDDSEKSSTKGFSLYIPKHNWNPNNLGSIGVQENGKFEIRITVNRDKNEYWDTGIKGVVDALQQAIIWWKECGEYTEEERIQHEDDIMRAGLEKEGEELLAEIRRQEKRAGN